MVGTLMSTLNNSIVNIANPIMAANFDVTMAQIQWVATIYLIVTSSLMLLFGRMGDKVGAHRIYIVGIAIFTAGSLACFLVNDYLPLLFARVLQGTGAAMSMSVGMALVVTIFPQSQRGRAMGASVTTVGLGNVLGAPVGGLVLAYASWHYIFLISVPFGLIAFLMAAIWLRSPVARNKETQIALKSSLLFTVAITCLIVFLSGGVETRGWSALAFCALIVVLIFVERRAKNPLFERSLLRNKRFILGNAISFLTYCAFMMLLFQLPFLLFTVWAVPMQTAGFLLTVNALTMAVSAPVAGFLSDRFGAFKVMIPALGAVVLSLGCAFLLGIEPNFVLFILLLFIAGAGMGFFNTPNNSDIMTAANKEQASFASGFVGTNRNLGFCIGTALSAGVFHFGNNISEGYTALTGIGFDTDASLHVFSFHVVLVISLALVLFGIGVCIYLVRSITKRAADSSAEMECERERESKSE